MRYDVIYNEVWMKMMCICAKGELKGQIQSEQANSENLCPRQELFFKEKGII